MGKSFLVVGDVHAVPSELEDCQKLLDLVHSTSATWPEASVVFLGDLFHYHSEVNVHVIDFWKRNLDKLDTKPIVLAGNHDKPVREGHYPPNAIRSLGSWNWEDSPITVVDLPTWDDYALYLPHIEDNGEFIRQCNLHPKGVVFCHQEFNGGKYDNGFYIKNGVDPSLIPQKRVISGHIHMPHQFGKVIYVGAPRWRSASDANTNRFITIFDIEETGEVRKSVEIATGTVCSRIWEYWDSIEKPLQVIFDSKDKYIINIDGPASWVQDRKEYWHSIDKSLRIRTLPRKEQALKVKESSGIDKAFKDYFDGFSPKNGTEKEVLNQMIKDRLNVKI